MIEKPILEVIACSVADAIEAEKGGAGRLEIVRNLQEGGLTPAFELVREIKNAVGLPLRVMVRESSGYQVRNDREIASLCNAAERFAALAVDGLVLGYLHEQRVDTALTDRILKCAPQLKATFHHAFEDAKDHAEALEAIKSIRQVDRILSSGGTGKLGERIERLNAYERRAGPELTIIAGGGIDRMGIAEIVRATRVREIHVGRAARLANRVENAVSAELVRNLVGLINETVGKLDVSDH